MAISDRTIDRMKPRERPFKTFLDDSLYIEVLPSGTRVFRVRYREGKRERIVTLGHFGPYFGIEDARRAKAEVDAPPPDPGAPTFGDLARGFLKAQAPRRYENYERNQWRRIEQNLAPLLDRPAEAISAPELLAVLRIVESRTDTMAGRLRILASQVFKFGIAAGVLTFDPARDIGAALVPPPPVEHQPCVPLDQFGPLVRAVYSYEGDLVTRSGLKLLLNLVVRSKDLTDWTWDEIDPSGTMWTIGRERLKQRREHTVPLSPQVRAILEDLAKRRAGSPYVLPSPGQPLRPISGNSLLKAFNRMEHAGFYQGHMTVHGVRSLFASILCEHAEAKRHPFSIEVIRACMSHKTGGKVWAAYMRSNLLEQRRGLMDYWSELIASELSRD